MMFKKILVCSDGSNHSLDALTCAAELTKIHKAQLTLLHVCALPTVREPFPGAPSLSGPAVDTYVREMHIAVIERALPVIKKVGACCEIKEEVGNPADVIARIANQQDYDLIVLGSRGISTDKAEKLGSVCHNVIHNASCPVLVVR
jgi:nucleotide-binding universal stress UspA family protein